MLLEPQENEYVLNQVDWESVYQIILNKEGVSYGTQ